ncbi:hypothetical protein D3C73_1581110 [compost metagenome]
MNKLPGFLLLGKSPKHLPVMRIDRDLWRTDIAQPHPIPAAAGLLHHNIRDNVPVLVMVKRRAWKRIQLAYPV